VFKVSAIGTLIRKVNSAEHGYSQELEHTVQQNGFIDEHQMRKWIRKIWKPFVLEKRQKYADRPDLMFILQLDHFMAHLTSNFLNDLTLLSTIMIEVPPKCTSKAQILDVGVNLSFKQRMGRLRTEWQLQNPTASVSRQLVSNWIAAAWTSITSDIIVNKCRRIGFFDQ
jgi:hypothetical protein